MMPFESFRTISYSLSIATMSVTSAVTTHDTNVTDTVRRHRPRKTFRSHAHWHCFADPVIGEAGPGCRLLLSPRTSYPLPVFQARVLGLTFPFSAQPTEKSQHATNRPVYFKLSTTFRGVSRNMDWGREGVGSRPLLLFPRPLLPFPRPLPYPEK